MNPRIFLIYTHFQYKSHVTHETTSRSVFAPHVINRGIRGRPDPKISSIGCGCTGERCVNKLMFILLKYINQDSCYNVRISFLSKLIPLLQSRKVPARYNVILFLTIHDPEEEVKTKVRLLLWKWHVSNWVIRLRRMCRLPSRSCPLVCRHLFLVIPMLSTFLLLAIKIQHLEMTFIRLLHLLAHHPDFSTSPEDMMDIAKFVWSVSSVSPLTICTDI